MRVGLVLKRSKTLNENKRERNYGEAYKKIYFGYLLYPSKEIAFCSVLFVPKIAKVLPDFCRSISVCLCN